MKRLLLFLIILMSYPLYSQIVLEKTISNVTENSSFWCVSFSKSGDKLVEINLGWGNDTLLINIYDSNYSILKSIVIEENQLNLKEVTFKKVNYISDNLFNLDDKIEFLCQIYYRGSERAICKGVFVLNEDAEILLKIENGNILSNWSYNSKKMEHIQKVNENFRLIIPLEKPDSHETKIYSLPGVLPETNKMVRNIGLFHSITASK